MMKRLESDWNSALSLLIAALGGAAIGMERQHSGHATGPHSRFGGLRTFTLLGLTAGAAGLFWAYQMQAVATAMLAAAAGLVLLAYFAAMRVEIDATTEVAALVVLASGFLAGQGAWKLSSGMIAATAVLLSEKTRLHALAESLPDVGLRAGFRFGLMALVVLPLLPEGPFGPGGGVRPRELWLIVLLISGLSFTGYVARLAVGARQGYVLTGLLGGIISSTNVTLTLSKISVKETAHANSLAIGVLTACTVMYLRVATVSTILNTDLGLKLLPYWIPPALTGALITYIGLKRKSTPTEATAAPENPLAVGSALQMAALFQMVLFGINLMRNWFGQAGLLWSGAVLGLTDVDALTISMSRSAEKVEDVATAALAIAIGCLTNSFFKLGVALVIGRGKFRQMAAAIFAALIFAAGVGIAWGQFF